ncbi:MAG TPA: hypothetical protein QF753_06270 [Victivallales bacterium]|nr:hypothetical protein [Victivallales bacterium]
MNKLSIYTKPAIILMISLAISICFLTETSIARSRTIGPIINPVTFTGRDINICRSSISGSSYGWKVLCAIPLSTPDYNTAVNNLWKNSGIPKSERGNYELVNIRETKGTDWGIIITGQDYLNVTADIVQKQPFNR